MVEFTLNILKPLPPVLQGAFLLIILAMLVIGTVILWRSRLHWFAKIFLSLVFLVPSFIDWYMVVAKILHITFDFVLKIDIR